MFEQPTVTVDVIVFTIAKNELHVALIKRGIEPFSGQWAIPGGFVLPTENLEDAAKRELREEVGVEDVFLEQLATFGDVERDPRGRVVTVAYYSLTSLNSIKNLSASSDADDARWFRISDLPKLAFDHDHILKLALNRLRSKLEYSTVAYALLPALFTLTQLQEVYEIILGRTLDKRNFRKRMLSLGLLQPTDQASRGAHRPAVLYEFSARELTFF